MDNHIPQINGDLLRMRREELGWALADLATRACLSKKQVKQIEEGGTSSFYSDTVKMTAAKKIGGILGLPEQSVFVVEESEVVPEALVSQNHTLPPTSNEVIAEHVDSAYQKTEVEVAASTGLDIANSNASQVDIASPAVKPYLKSPSLETTVIQKSTNSALDSEDKPKSKNSLWFIIALFVAALGLAAVMQKPATPPPPAEPPPPIQVLPPEPADPAASAPGAVPTSAAAPIAPVASPAQAASSASSIPSATPGTAPVSALPASRPSVVYSSPSSAPSAAPAPAVSVAPAAATSQAAPASPSASKPQ
jgi:transcriptional regulator with XRE-family HTH domain